jgi:hypothetical protein
MSKYQEIIDRSKNPGSKEEISELVGEISELILENNQNTELLHSRAVLYVKQQFYGKAINDYRTILTINDKDKIAAGHLEMLSTIMRFTGNDIYANPNTNLDPWLE